MVADGMPKKGPLRHVSAHNLGQANTTQPCLLLDEWQADAYPDARFDAQKYVVFH